MAITFLMPGPLRPFAGGQSLIAIETSPATLADALQELWKRYPGIRDRVATEQGQIREHINVFVGNDDVRYTGGLQTPIPDGAEIAIIPAISGGAARMKDIAEDLGVSLMTVSKALRSHRDISEETRNLVLKRARQLGYQPDWIARCLATRRTYMVGVVIPDLMHSFFAEVAKGVARKLGPLGYQIVLSNTEEDAEAEQRQIESLISRSVDGIIVASAQASWGKRLVASVKTRKVHYVLIDRMPRGIDGNYVGVNDEEIGALATEHLIEQGRRRIAHIRGPALPHSAGRLRGYRRALAKRGLGPPPELIVRGESNDAGGFEAMRRLLKLADRPDGVFCYNDPVAAGAIKAALEAGLGVPRDIAIIGAGNVHYSDLLRVPLSTIDQSSSLIGETAADLLVHCMESKTPPPPQRVLISPRLVVRESTRRLTGS